MPALVLRPFLAVGLRRSSAAPAKAAARRTAEAPLSPKDAQRFRSLMLPHLDAAYAFARYLTRDAAAAEDLVQDAYLAAYRAFGGYRGGEPKAWLFAILRRARLGQARRDGGVERADAEAARDLPDPGESAEALLMRAADDAAVRAAIEALAEPFREAIVLRELQDLSYREIAEITEVPIGTVMSRLARARRLLAAALGAEDPA